jgi:LuxR family transcriptional regulator
MKHQKPNCLADLERAINKLDFYRLFKCLCVKYELDLLTVFDLNNWPEETAIESLMVVVNKDDSNLVDLDVISISEDNLIFHNMRNEMLHDIWDSPTISEQAKFCGDLSKSVGISVPLHTPNGRHFGIWLVMQKTIADKSDFDQLVYSCKLVFQNFFNEIILPDSMPVISPRELEVIRWSSEGKTSVEIAIILGLSEHTINSYTTKILQKLQVVNRAQMVAKAIRMGLIK